MSPLRFLPLTLVLLFSSLPASARAEDIMPPFGLNWGESPDRIAGMLGGAKASIKEKRTLKGRSMWTVEGLSQPNLKYTVFYFRHGGLDEVELQYQNTNWIDQHYNDYLGSLRGKIERRFGPGRLLARSKAPVSGGITQTLVGYSWAKGPSQIELVYFSAEVPSQVFRTLSLHYKAAE